MPRRSKITSATVNTIYIPYKSFAVDLTFGTSFPTEGPGLSALIRFKLLPPDIGSIATKSTKTHRAGKIRR